MRGATYFTHPAAEWQKRYEALRASFVERLPAQVVAGRYGYSPGYIHLLRHQFRYGKIDFDEPVPEGLARRRGVSKEIRQKIRSWRERHLSAGEITQLLSEDSVEISVRTVERILAEEGFSKLPRRTRLKVGTTVLGAGVPKVAHAIGPIRHEARRCFDSPTAGVFLFAPFIAQLGIAEIVRSAGLPGTKAIPAESYLLSFLGLKLLGNERFAHVGDHAFDPGLGLFAGLNVLPKCTAMSTYSYGLDGVHIARLQRAFLKAASRLGLYDGKIVNLDFHTVPHYGEKSVLEKHWAGARGKVMKGALTLLAQDAETKLLVYSDADIQRSEADDAVLDFLAFWRKVRRGPPTLIFDSRLTSYPKLSELNKANTKFITLIITNDHDQPVESVVGNYARRWRVENGIAEAVKFFHLNALSSPILVKVHFDVVMTILADTLYTMLARKLRGFQECDAPTLYRHFVRGKGTIELEQDTITVTYPRRAHNPILRAVPWDRLPTTVPWLGDASVALRFK